MRKQFIHANPVRRNREMTTKDRLLLLALMAVYAIVAFVNLGSTRFPTTVWTPEYGETAILDLGTTTDVAEIRLNGNIAEGILYIYDDNDNYVPFDQDYGDMFKWKSQTLAMHTQYIRLLVVEGRISLNEVALFDANGNRLSAAVYRQTDGTGNDLYPNQQALLDEQNTVPDTPSYLDGMYFDEIYHARTAYEIVTDDDLYLEGRSVGVTDFSYVHEHGYAIYEWTHPQLGKMLIAVGVRLFGMTPFGWRFTGTLFGVLMLWVLYALAKRILRSTEYAFLAAALFAVDCMHFSQTRIATIDVYALFFTLLMLLCMLDYLISSQRGDPFRKQMVPLGLCGLTFGLGAASKWTCLYTGAGLAVLFFVQFFLRCYDIGSDRIAAAKTKRGTKKIAINPIPALPVLYAIGAFVLFLIAKVGYPSGGLLYRIKYDMEWYDLILADGFWIPMLVLTALAIVSAVLFDWYVRGKDFDLRWNEQLMTLVLCCVFFIVIPALIYYASCYSFYLSENRNTLKEQLKCLWDKQKSMYAYHANLNSTHPSQSEWYQWPLAEKSVWFYASYPDGKLSNISSTGNPAVWYTAAFGGVFMAIEFALNRKNWKNRALWVVLVGVLSGLLAWRFVSRCVFLYHYFSALPFVLLAAVYFLSLKEQQYPGLKNLKWVWLGVAVTVFALMYPAVSGLPTSWEYAGLIEHIIAFFGKVYYVGV